MFVIFCITLRYVVNKKRTDKESFDRLKSHVPNLDGKNDVTQLDVLLEAIQYITALRKDLGKEALNEYLKTKTITFEYNL